MVPRLGLPLLLVLALLAPAGATPSQACGAAASALATAVASGGACADGAAGNGASACSAACTTAVAAYATGCGADAFVDANVFALLELGKNLSTSTNAACRNQFLTQAQVFANATGNADVCSNAVLLLGGSIENYGVCPTTGTAFTGACPAGCTALLGSMSSLCSPTAVVRLPALALQMKGVSCTLQGGTCPVGPASFAVPATTAALHLPGVCTAGAATPSSAPAAGARHGLLAAAALVALTPA